MAKSDLTTIGIIDNNELIKVLNRLNSATEIQKQSEEDLFNTKVANANALFDLEIKMKSRLQKKELDIQKQAREDFINLREQAIDRAIALEKKKRKKSNKKLSEEELKELRKKVEDQFEYKQEIQDKLEAKARKKSELEERKRQRKEAEQRAADLQEDLFGKGHNIEERVAAIKELTTVTGQFSVGKAIMGMTKVLSNMAQKLDKKVDEIAASRAEIDTRLQGSGNSTFMGSYWDRMNKQLIGIAGASPFYKQEAIVNNLKNLVSKGISYNVTQRAFLQTIREKIATTFDVNNGTLLRLIRIQQQDTTAGRLGMESALNSFLNRMYETTEYMSDIMTSVKGSLEESMSLMEADAAAAFEFQVQKWMGSLYSVGMSSSAVQNIAGALGKLAAGDIEGLMGSGVGNLLVMAASKSGLNISDILAKGIDESETNQLMQATVSYLSDIYKESSDSRIVQQQMANVFGVAASDLKAAANLAQESTMKSIFGHNLDYAAGIRQLELMASTMGQRTSLGEMLSNTWENFQYTMASGIASNPVLYMLNKTAGLLDDLVGGIAIPAVSVLGNMVDLHTTVADFMRVGAFGSSILSGMGRMIGAGGGGFSPVAALKQLGISNKISTVSRGTAATTPIKLGGIDLSESGLTTFTGNSSSSDIEQATFKKADSEVDKKMVQAQEEESTAVSTDIIDEHIVNIYTLLQEVIDGASSFTVKMAYSNEPAWSK